MQSLLIVYIVFVLSIYLLYTKESYETKVDKTKCRKMAHRKLWSTYDWTSRVMNKGAWKCPSGWQNTGCTWEMGNEFEKKQCRRKKSETTSEDKNTKRSDQTKLLRAGIHAQTVAIVSQGGTIKGSTRFNSKNVTDEQLAQRLADLKKQFKELKKNKSGPQPAAAEGQSAAAPAAAPAACSLRYYVDRGGVSEEIQHKQCTAKDLRGLNVSRVLVQNGTAVIRVLEEIFSADGSGQKTKDVAVKGTPGKPGELLGDKIHPILEIVSFTSN